VGSLELAPDLRLELADGLVAVQRGTDRRVLGCTAAAGPGRVHAITALPDGTVVAACERGLFVCDRDHLVLDAPDVRDGLPPGAPRSVHADAAGRVWLCTETAFGVVDVHHGFGRTFTPADGLPAPPFLRVADGGGGRLLLETAAGVFAYAPDLGPAPRTATPAARRALTATSDGTVAIDLEVQALGGASLRQRRRHHHLLVAVDGAMLRGLRPGSHVVEVHAIDRDLRRSLVAEYDVVVPLPAVFDTRLLPVLAGIGALLVWVFAWLGTSPGRTRWQRVRLATGRAALAVVVLLQGIAACLGYGRSWPFMGFSMYTQTWQPDSVLHHPWIEATRADGSRRIMQANEAGVVQDDYWPMLAEIVFGGEVAHRRFFEQVAARRRPDEAPYVGFVLCDGRIRLTQQGPVDVAPRVLVHYVAR
jgi:hypothetical protein